MALNAKANPNYVPKRINGKFAPGWSGNPGGSLEATHRSFNKDFLLALAADFKKHGAAAIEKVRKLSSFPHRSLADWSHGNVQH
jgi:hypothetical protein